MFTVYIIMILNFTSFVPCSCGGVLENLGWIEHLIFNSVFIILGLLAIATASGLRHTLIVGAISGTLASSLLVTLFLISEEAIHQENPFIRRIPMATAAKTAAAKLPNSAMYIAGATKDSIYVTDRRSPLHVFVYDTQLKNKKHHTITLDRENFKFRELLLKVLGNNFYLYDGSVPVIYKGLVTNWKAKVISHGEYAFNDIIFINNNQRILLGQERSAKENVLAVVNDKDSVQVTIHKSVLQKQGDGIFDTGGSMLYSAEFNKFIYLYRYRNQFIVSNPELQVEYHGTTIDTITKAQLKIAKIKSGDTKMAAPPLVVNKTATVTNNLLLVNSMLKGRFESTEVWTHATAIDVYDITTNRYLVSFYVYDENGYRMKSCYATQEALYVIIGPQLQKYGYGKQITSQFKYNNIPASIRNEDRTPVEKSRSQ